MPRTFGIKQSDRLSHLYVIGKTGADKSTLLHTMAQQDLATGRGLCLIDLCFFWRTSSMHISYGLRRTIMLNFVPLVLLVDIIALTGCAAPVFVPEETTSEQVKEALEGKVCRWKYDWPCRKLGHDTTCSATTDVKFIRDGASIFAHDLEFSMEGGQTSKDRGDQIVTVVGRELSFRALNWVYRLSLADDGGSMYLLGNVSKRGETYEVTFRCRA
jgi:hypothetical protein